MDLSLLQWVKVITDDDNTKWAYTRERLKDMNNVIDTNEVTIFPLGFRDQRASKPEQGSLMALIQKGKLTHLVEVLDKTPYATDDWWHRLVRVIWWKPQIEWKNLPPQSDFLGFDPTLMDGKPHLLLDLQKYRERWDNNGGFSEFKLYLSQKIS